MNNPDDPLRPAADDGSGADVSEAVTRYYAALERRHDAFETIKLSQKVIQQVDSQTPHLEAELKALGYNPADADFWIRLRASMGEERYWDALNRALNAMGKVPITPGSDSPESPVIAAHVAKHATLRQLILDALESVFPKGLGAAEIQTRVEQRRLDRVRERTVGEMLYRLSRAALIHREGSTWFLVPPRAEGSDPDSYRTAERHLRL